MKLHIQHNDVIHRAAEAAFIRGSEPLKWLKEIDSWNIPLHLLECYLLPLSPGSIDAAGLFVIFKEPDKIKALSLLEPYACLEQKLYVPVNAMLLPEVSKKELKKLLIWEKQVFHPSIGFVGFEKKDSIHLADLLGDALSVDRDWSYAHPGLLQKPVLQQIQVVQPTIEELMNDMKRDVGEKPLEEIPYGGEGKPTIISKIWDTIKWVLLRGLFSLGGFIEKIIPVSSSPQSNVRGEGLLQKLNHWLQQNMEELERKRNTEIERLLKLFDENNNEALEYAIPLNSPYLNRGSAAPSSTLTRRLLDFNLRNLGGGQSLDGWNLGSYYHDLRKKYLSAAQKETDRKDFKKAAYIYAHLLGDYPAAANVLKQGGKFREAAALYKDHLKNITLAAECLEEGSLYIEAIELYKELKKEEKVGDLYTKLEQKEQADTHYENAISAKLQVQDYLDAARLMNDKMGQPERSQQTLLEGWGGTNQASNCLKKYFDVVLNDESLHAEKELRDVFTKHTPPNKKLPFLDVMDAMMRKKRNEPLADTIQTIAYEIVHSETEDGNPAVLHQLKRFFPEDNLIASDTSRYTSTNRSLITKSNAQDFHLNPNIAWLRATWHRNQFLAIGLLNGTLQMARGNWYGNLEYYSWENLVPRNTWYTFINSPYYSNTVLLHATEGLPITRKNLQKNRYFTEALLVYCPIWMHKKHRQIIINEEQHIISLDAHTGSLTLHEYNLDGDLKKSANCSWENQEQVRMSEPLHPYIAHHDKYYYTFLDKIFLSISASGSTRAFEFESGIRLFAASHSFKDFHLVISTNQGCFLCKPSQGTLNISGEIFAEKSIPNSISFITADRFVMVDKKTATVFEIKEGKETPEAIGDYRTQGVIIAALPTSNRHQFVLMEEGGKMGFCDL